MTDKSKKDPVKNPDPPKEKEQIEEPGKGEPQRKPPHPSKKQIEDPLPPRQRKKKKIRT